MGLSIAQSNHKEKRFRFKVNQTKLVTFRCIDGFLKRAEGRGAKSLEWILQKWQAIEPANELQMSTLPQLLEDVQDAVCEYSLIGGRPGLRALLKLLQCRNRGIKETGMHGLHNRDFLL